MAFSFFWGLEFLNDLYLFELAAGCIVTPWLDLDVQN